MDIPSHKTTPRDVFLYLLAIITLYISVWRLIALLFEYVNALFPDKLAYDFNSFDTIRWSISSLLIVFPVYLGTTWYLRKDFIRNPEKRELKIRKWLLNFTLFVAALTIIVDLITLVNTFLNGELTTRFLLKVVIVLIIAGAVLAYYVWDLKRTTTPESHPSKTIAAVALVVVVASIAGGFFVIGSPLTQRQRRFDERRINDLQMLQGQIISYWTVNSKLPDTVLEADMGNFTAPKDPENVSDYEYKITGPLSFELCAVFGLASLPDKGNMPRPYYGGPYDSLNQHNWNHSAGRVCFSQTIDPDFYKPPFAPPAVRIK